MRYIPNSPKVAAYEILVYFSSFAENAKMWSNDAHESIRHTIRQREIEMIFMQLSIFIITTWLFIHNIQILLAYTLLLLFMVSNCSYRLIGDVYEYL